MDWEKIHLGEYFELIAAELASSKSFLFQIVQQESFNQEFKALSSKKPTHNISKMTNVHPIFHNKKNTFILNFMAPFYGWGSNASRLKSHWASSLLFTI